jgi:F0F1-type ATP synthase membrane subunit a
MVVLLVEGAVGRYVDGSVRGALTWKSTGNINCAFFNFRDSHICILPLAGFLLNFASLSTRLVSNISTDSMYFVLLKVNLNKSNISPRLGFEFY